MIIRRYLMKEIGLTFLATLFVLLLIIVGNTFVRLLGKVSDGNLPVDVLGQLVLFGSLNGAIQLIPVALLVGMMLAFGRLYQDHEMSALHAAGLGPWDFYKAIFLWVLPLTIIMTLMIVFLLPWVDGINEQVKNEVKQRPESSGIPQGEFLHSSHKGREFTVFIETLDEEKAVMKHFFMHMESESEEEDTIVLAESAILFIDPNSGERVVQINNGSRYDRKMATDEFAIFRFSEHGLRVPELEVESNIDLDMVPISELIASNNPEYIAEFHWRIAVILSTPVMAFLAFPLSYTEPRQGRYGKLALGILIYAVYANLMISGKSMLEQEKIPLWIGLWWVHIMFIMLGLWMLWQRYGRRHVPA